jgi:hypothetical protein
MDGLLFGIIDNGVLAICALLGIDIDKKLSGAGLNGALYGALFGNALSDGIGSLLDFGYVMTFWIVLGCLSVVPVVYLYQRFND